MRPRRLLPAWLLFILFAGCSHDLKVVHAGPSVHDQLTGRGYITPGVDSLTPKDSLRLLRDTLRQDH
jgi:hypothetical protein